MKRDKITLVALLVVSCLGAASLSYGEQAADEKHDAASEVSTSGRVVEEPTDISESFKSLDEALKAKKSGTVVFSLEKEKEKTSVTLDLEKIKSLQLLLTAVKEYADKMKKCVTENKEDKVSSAFLSSLNSFVTYVKEQEVLTAGSKTINEKEINTRVVALEKAFEAKSKKFEGSTGDFDPSDKKVKDALIEVAKVLQGGTWEKTVVNNEQLNEDKIKAAIEKSGDGFKACKLDESTTSATANDNTAPVTNQDVLNPATGAGAGGLGSAGFQQPSQVPLNPATGFQNNQLLDELRRLTDERDRDRELRDELLRRQFEEQNRDSDQALAALQRALGQAQRPNVSRGNSDRSEQGPQISPSVSIPPSQQQPYQQMQMPQLPPPQPMPLGQLMNNGPVQPMIPYTPSRFNDEIAARPPVPTQPDPTTMALLQTMQQQNQMFQQMMMGRYPYMGNGAPNVYGTNANALQSLGRGAVTGAAGNTGRPRVLPQRFQGSARGGVAGKIGVNPSARGNVPTRLQR